MTVNFTPNGPHLLDTSAVILMSRAGVTASPQARLSFVAYGELLIGVHRSANPTWEGARLDSTIGAIPIIYPTRRTMNLYAQQAARLQEIGHSIPTNDLWIAVLALKRDLPLLTADAHFTRVQGLKLQPVR